MVVRSHRFRVRSQASLCVRAACSPRPPSNRVVNPMEDTALLLEASRALSLNQRELAELLGISSRTVQRWFARRSSPISLHWHALARATHGAQPALAARLARQGGSSLEELALVAQPPPASGAAALPRDVLAD